MRQRSSGALLIWALPLLLALVLGGCGHSGAGTAPWARPAAPAGLTLTDLHDIGELQKTFNQDTGKPRLIMLVSPT